MTFIIADYNDDNDTLIYFWGNDDLEFGTASHFLDEVFDTPLVPGAEPWPLYFEQECTILTKLPNLQSPDDVKRLMPELFL